ncbi:MAG: hypothetical protein EOP00_28770, partial [Pedobacter sp.]
MFSKTELTEKLTAELRELAKANGVDNAGDLRKSDLIEEILKKQNATAEAAVTPEPAADENATEKPARKRTRIAKDGSESAPAPKKDERPTLFDESDKIEIPSPDFEAIALVTGQDLSKQESIADKIQNQKNKKDRTPKGKNDS